jgi:arylsulfatase A-like enzyme
VKLRGRVVRRSFLAAILALAGCGGEQARLSVVLVSIDTLRADHLGLYGYERDTSPFLDRLAKQSLVFEHAFTSAAWTLIAHMSMLTGLYPEQHGVTEKGRALAAEAPLLAERLARAGYQTVGLYHPGWVHERHGFARGFDVFRAHGSAEEAEQHVSEELARLDPARQAFLFLHLFDVHSDPTTRTPPTVFSSPPPFQDHFLPGASARLAGETYDTLKKHGLPPEKVEAMVALYDDGILHVDTVLERIFTRLESEGLLEGALVIVTADHGESLAQRDNWGHGGPWQEGVRVPLILRLPKHERAGERVEAPVHLVDIVTTVLAFAGLPADPALPGCSLLAPLPAERVVAGGQDPVHYLVRWPRKMTRAGERVGWFDLATDPGEKNPQRASLAEFEALRAALRLDPASFHPPLAAATLSPADKAELEALGYAGEVDGE